MTYPDSEGNVWSRIGETYDRVALRLRRRGIGSVMCFPRLTEAPAYATPNLPRTTLDLRDFTALSRARIADFCGELGVRAVVYVDLAPGLVPFAFLHGLGLRSINGSRFSWPEEEPAPVRRAVDWVRGRLGLAHHDLYLANSRHQHRFLTQTRMIPEARVVLAVNGVDATQFAPGPSDAVERYNLPRTEHYVSIVCQARPEKRVGFLLEVAAQFFRDRPELAGKVTFVYAGDGGERAAWQATAARLGLGRRFVFLGQVGDVAAVHRLASVMLHAASRESFGFALAEAMACGVPVICADAGGPREMVLDGLTGYIVEQDNRAEFVRLLGQLLGDPARRDAMGKAARQRIVSHFPLDQQADLIADVLAREVTRTTRRAA